MPITKDDIKLLESQRMTDFDDGGGRMTGNVIVDGQSNNIFPDVSELDRTFGRVNLRKTFPAVLTPNTDVYFGAHVIVEQPPQDDNIDVLLFSTEDWNDVRTQARDVIERYVVAGPIGPWFLFDTQVEGQKQLLMFARVGDGLPNVGDVLYLIENEDQVDEYSQFVRVTEVSSEDQTFTDTQGTFHRQVFTCQISDPLRDTYHGPNISREDVINPDARVRTTLVADASQYFGVKPLAQQALTGATQLTVDSVYGQLVPSARSETPVVDTPLPTKPVSITSGAETFDIIGPSHTHAIEVTLGNRAFSYVASLKPIPSPGRLVVEYRALGQWQRLEDDGTGILDGAGSGSVNFQTGSVSVTLQALPDVGSSVVFTWSTTVHYVNRAGTTINDLPIAPIQLNGGAVPGSVTLSWTAGGLAKSATVANDGVISGDASGNFVHATGEGYIEFTEYPDNGTQITVDWDEAPNLFHETFNPDTGGPQVQFNLANPPVKPGSVEISIRLKSQKSFERVKKGYHFFFIVDDINRQKALGWSPPVNIESLEKNEKGYLLVDHANPDVDNKGSLALNGGINYGTGAVIFNTADTITAESSFYQSAEGDWTRSSTIIRFQGQIVATYAQDSGTPVTHSTPVSLPSLQFDLLPNVSDSIIPGTLRFSYGGQNYSDRAGGGVLYLDDGTVAGEVEYDAGMVTLSVFNAGATLTINSLVSVFGDWYDDEFFFRTSGSPLQPGSLIVNATTLDGTALTESSDPNGLMSSATAEGQVEQEMGVVQIRFGALVADSSLTTEEKSEPWYDPANVDGDGNIWKPTFVFPNTVRHNEVVFKFLPLDADILGLDPVRLPSDGRVPIYRPGGVVVVHHTGQIIENSPTNGQVIDTLRNRLTKVRIEDDNGQVMAEADFSADLDAGTVTLVNVAPYTAPLTIFHTIADMAMVSDVQIDGTLTLTRQLTHDFPVDESLASSTLLIGDMQARFTNLFDQASWTGEWSDTVIGSEATATFNEVQNPIVVTNDGALTERWYCRFLNTTEVEIFGENVGGLLLAGENRWAIAGDIAPVNPATNEPYFTIPAAGWGAGWATGNVLRFNTIGANYPLWIARSIQQSEGSSGSDKFCIQIRGDIDA
ncbi:conserved hypothetical protein [Nitrosococcus halophilus Nc 4]|uniref:Uncharacterized protein n=1 Tax=Nitrosococcus halophilus (strain Nc4) TaxID=472759 RepID=D5BYX0_NITHN|nr:hypothetical protein [Nitrosococcus halophilus]ADE14183.1 conserved hypothetical protein [Nitrosococcus halophilus Nc 4]